MYDLPNNNVKVGGSARIINFNILSEEKVGSRRNLSLLGYDEEGNIYTANGWFDKEDYILRTVNLAEYAGGVSILLTDGEGQPILTDDGKEIQI